MPAHNFLSALTGSFAMPAAENPTVAMIEAAYRHHRLDARYLNCEVAPAKLGDAVRGAKAMGWVGFNCSLPHKVAVLQYLDGVGASAEVIGAVNCVVNRGGKLMGENTDGVGFMESLRTMVDAKGKQLVVFGAGGAARAIAVEAALAGAASIEIVNRDVSRGEELARLVNEKTKAKASFTRWDRVYAIGSADIVVNATSIGLYPDIRARLNIAVETLRPGLIVADVIPTPPRTLLIEEAAARGCKTLDGLGMLVNQGVVSIKHWLGVNVEARVMRAKVEELFSA